MAAEGDRIYYTITGEEERNERGFYIVPDDATHVSVHESVTVIPANLFYDYYMSAIFELICHAGVIRIENGAFASRHRLRRVVMRGVKVLEGSVFACCQAITYVECEHLERIGQGAFSNCKSLGNINLPSAKVVEALAFDQCKAMTEATFGQNLETIDSLAFVGCTSLARITIPLKNGLFKDIDTGRNCTDVFTGCVSLKYVDFVERHALYDTIATLLLEEWRNDMTTEVDSINQILPIAYAGYMKVADLGPDYRLEAGEKTVAIRDWISRVLSKIIDYKAQHRRLLNEAATTLEPVLPHDAVLNHVVPFLELPLHTFDGEED